MIAFGTVVSEPEAYVRYARPGIAAVAETDSVVHAFSAVGPLARGTNLLLDAVAGLDDLEALVLVHPHCELADPALLSKVRAALADPDVAVVGCMGATGVKSMAWWEGSQVLRGDVVHRFTEHGGGDLPAYAWAHPKPAPAEVDAVDGFLMVLSPWAVRNVRFDEELWIGGGYDVDYCLRVREQGRKVLVADLRTIQHRSLDLVGEPEVFTAAHLQFAGKWASANGEVDWKARARRAEAEREAVRAVAYFDTIRAQARVDALQAELDRMEASPGWGLTAPLRRLNQRRRERAGSPPSR